jgi:hypothetical protein
MRFALGCAMAAAVGMPAAAIEARALVSKGSAPMTLARALEDDDEVDDEAEDDDDDKMGGAPAPATPLAPTEEDVA